MSISATLDAPGRAPHAPSAPPVRSRARLKDCGDCTLCCKVYDVDDLEKKAGKMCHNAGGHGGSGCSVWGLHPKSCQDFKCLWLKHDDMNGLWRPDVAGFVMRLEGTTVNIDVDPERPYAWRHEPYYNQIKMWSEVMPKGEGLVVVHAPEGIYVITPMEDLSLRAPKRGEVLETGMEMSLFGMRPYARIVLVRDARHMARRRA